MYLPVHQHSELQLGDFQHAACLQELKGSRDGSSTRLMNGDCGRFALHSHDVNRLYKGLGVKPSFFISWTTEQTARHHAEPSQAEGLPVTVVKRVAVVEVQFPVGAALGV